MARAKRVAAAKSRKGRTAAARAQRAELLREVEARWCALSSAMAVFQSLSAEQRGLTLSDLHAVDVLAREGTVCASELAGECGLTKGAVTGMLNRLERAGVARRVRDEDDARRLVITAVADPSGCDCRVPHTFREVIASFRDEDLALIQRFLSDSARALRHESELLRDAEGGDRE